MLSLKSCPNCDVEQMFDSEQAMCYDCGGVLVEMELVAKSERLRDKETIAKLREALEKASESVKNRAYKDADWATEDVALDFAEKVVAEYKQLLSETEPK